MELLAPSVKRFLLTPFSCAFNPAARERWRLTVTNSTLLVLGGPKVRGGTGGASRVIALV
jgi:hypothetical protein